MLNNRKLNTMLSNLAICCGINDVDTAKKLYRGFVRFVVRETVRNGELVMPDFGKFQIKELGEHKSGLGNCSEFVPVSKVFKFYPSRKLRDYVKRT